jgi:DNA-binding NarL/FixJ family response regulator
VGEFRVLLASDRPAVGVFFAGLVRGETKGFVLDHLPVAVDALLRGGEAVRLAAVGVVDTGPDPDAALDVCRYLLERRPDLPTAALFCCPHSTTPDRLRALSAVGVRSLVDLQVTCEELLAALHRMARGDVVLHLQLDQAYGAIWQDALAGTVTHGASASRRALSGADGRLLDLMVRDLTDHEIARRIHRSPHTVKHQLDRLRRLVGVRSRVALAVWAVHHGYGRGGETDARSVEPALQVTG